MSEGRRATYEISVIDSLNFPAALMLSAFKAQHVAYSPASIKRTLCNSALPLGTHDSFSVGQGIIQVSI